jgi:hypothetical protein
MRDEMLSAVIRRAIQYPEFRRQLADDPQAALSEHGFALESREMEMIEKMRPELRSDGTDVEQRLISIGETYGVRVKGEERE